MTEDQRRSYLLVGVAVLAVALVVRLGPLYWSPLPATLDGFGHARTAAILIETGQYPLPGFRADQFVFSGVLAVASLAVGEQPLYLAQPFVAVVGAFSCLIPVALVREFGLGLGWSPRRVRYAATLAGLALALDGIYARRTGVPDEELLAYLLIPLLALALYRTLDRGRLAWLVVTLGLMLVLPLTHSFSTLIAALTVTGVVSAYLPGVRRLRTWLVGVGLVGGFWVYFATYYAFAARSEFLTVAYVDRITAQPSLFLAWLVVLVVGIAWWLRASRSWQRAAFLFPIAVGLLVVIANAFLAVFPGTIRSPPLVLGLILLYVIPVVIAGVAVPRVSEYPPTGIVVAALLAAPVINTYFSLTATLTPDFFGTVVRTQTFAHLPVMMLAALAVMVIGTGGVFGSRVSGRAGTAIRVGVAVLFVGAVAATTPLAYINLDTGSVPSTTLESEYAATQFVVRHVEGPVATDHTISRILGFSGSNGTYTPTREWLLGGSPPACPVVSQQSWTTTGAHLFPAAPQTIASARYEAALAERHVVYAASGLDPVTLSLPLNDSMAGC
ncbi:MAG: sodium/phosphate symporter [Haloarculaceae archaeon]